MISKRPGHCHILCFPKLDVHTREKKTRNSKRWNWRIKGFILYKSCKNQSNSENKEAMSPILLFQLVVSLSSLSLFLLLMFFSSPVIFESTHLVKTIDFIFNNIKLVCNTHDNIHVLMSWRTLFIKTLYVSILWISSTCLNFTVRPILSSFFPLGGWCFSLIHLFEFY